MRILPSWSMVMKLQVGSMSFLRKDGRVWTTDKDGLIPDLLAAEITAKTGKNPIRNGSFRATP